MSPMTYGIRNGAFDADLGDLEPLVEAALDAWDRQRLSRLLWAKDPAPWKQPLGEPELTDRLDWLTAASMMLNRVEEIEGFAREVRDEGFTAVVVLGMGGSSLSPEVSARTFGTKPGFPRLLVLDSTVPQAVTSVEREIEGEKTLFIVSSKSGGTIETLSAHDRFLSLIPSREHYIAITDPGSALDDESRFRRVFRNMPEIGGRYSALSYFGLVPAALIGVDIRALLESARKMMEACGDHHPARNNPGVALGAIMAQAALRGRDKMTLLFAPELQSFGCWIEQLVAESTGKHGRGILPVEGEPVGGDYADDRLFVYTGLKGSVPILPAGHPVVTIEIDDLLDLGQEYFRWEIAAAAASAFLAVNAFNQPDVGSSKKITAEILADRKQKGRPALTKLAHDPPLTASADDETARVLADLHASGPYTAASIEAALHAHLRRFEPGNYVALMAFIERTDAADDALAAIRAQLKEKLRAAVTLGYGPRFLHSTGQFHKGGPNTGLFVQITADGSAADVSIPGAPYSFEVLKDAQATGDYRSLRAKGCRAIRIHLGADVDAGLDALRDAVSRLAPIK